MNNKIKNICVFASASNDLPEIYYQAAQRLGHLIGENGYNIVYGGSHRGLMYATAKAAKDSGGSIYAVMPQKMIDVGFGNPQDCAEFYITEGMRERKAKLDEISDAVIAIAGGFGTLEEISEMIVQKQLGYSNKPTIILNTNNFYNNLIKFFDDVVEQGFAGASINDALFVANTPEEAINHIQNYKPVFIESRLTENLRGN